MNDEQIRKDFEEWMGDGGLSPRALERNSVGDYILMQTAHAWEVWLSAAEKYGKEASPTSRSCVTGTPFLQEEDQHALYRFIETTEDGEGFDIGKNAIKRLANLGVVESFGFGRYGVTMFGYWVHEKYWHQNPSLPLKTNSDRDADARAAIAKATGSESSDALAAKEKS